MITTPAPEFKDGFFTATVTVEVGPKEVALRTAEQWWWTIEGKGTSRNSGKALAYALEDLAAKILAEESK